MLIIVADLDKISRSFPGNYRAVTIKLVINTKHHFGNPDKNFAHSFDKYILSMYHYRSMYDMIILKCL